jgi:hypothetical protein
VAGLVSHAAASLLRGGRHLLTGSLHGLVAALQTPRSAASSSYSSTVIADGPVVYYRLGDASGATTAVDSSGNNRNGTYTLGQLVQGVSGAIVGDTDTAVTFSPNCCFPNSQVTYASGVGLPSANAARSVEAWFKTAAGPREGGDIVTWGGAATRQGFLVRVANGNQLLDGRDVWWTIPDSRAERSQLAEEQVAYLHCPIRPALESLGLSTALMALWEGGSSPGLTRVQRERYLAQLRRLKID